MSLTRIIDVLLRYSFDDKQRTGGSFDCHGHDLICSSRKWVFTRPPLQLDATIPFHLTYTGPTPPKVIKLISLACLCRSGCPILYSLSCVSVFRPVDKIWTGTDIGSVLSHAKCLSTNYNESFVSLALPDCW